MLLVQMLIKWLMMQNVLNPDVQVIKASLKQGEGLSEIISAINKQKR